MSTHDQAGGLRAAIRRLRGEDDGAVMIMGTWMSLALIGVTWYTLGIGDALIFREKAQEAADAAAFSAATVHAKGMNFISAINTIMLVMIILWLLVNVAEDILGSVYDLVGGQPGKLGPVSCLDDGNDYIPNAGGFSVNVRRSCCTPATTLNLVVQAGTALSGGSAGSTFCSISSAIKGPLETVQNSRQRLESNVLRRVLPALSTAEKVVKNIVAPAGGFAAGFLAGRQYDMNTPVAALSMLPMPEQSLTRRDFDTGIGGLPTTTASFYDMCAHATTGVIGWIRNNVLGNIPGVGTLIEAQPFSTIADIITDAVSNQVSDRYCSFNIRGPGTAPIFRDTEQAGWQAMAGSVPNGAEQMQVWAFNVRPEYDDKRAKNVNMGTGGYVKTAAPTASTGNKNYYAQAEYYYDCNQGWAAGECNGNDNATFNMRWRARLKRTRKLQIGNLGGSVLTNAIGRRITEAQTAGFGAGAATNLGEALEDSSIAAILNAGVGAAGPAVDAAASGLNPDADVNMLH